MTTVLNLFGAPGAGKSTLAAELFSQLKTNNKNCELVREYVKLWAYEGKEVTPLDQVYLLGKQVRSEAMLYGKVDYIITDSPILLVGVYQHLFFNGDYIQKTAMSVMKEAKEKYNVRYVNYLLPMREEIKEEGRFHNKEQVKMIDKYLPMYLALCNESAIITNDRNVILKDLGITETELADKVLR